MDKKDEIIAELLRVAKILQASKFTKQQFNQHSRIHPATVERGFGTWNKALVAAGLTPTPSFEDSKVSDDDYLMEIIELTKEIGKQPTTYELHARGHFTAKPYRQRWGSWPSALRAAYRRYGFPLEIEDYTVPPEPTSNSNNEANSISVMKTDTPYTFTPLLPGKRKKVQYGEPLDFRGLRHAPINEQGVVYIFGMVSRELGFLIESIRTAYPDCEGKRYVDQKRQRLEPVLIEFEYQSSNFRLHGHNSEGCDLIVCWIHDWEDCPLEVLELSSQIKYLPNQ